MGQPTVPQADFKSQTTDTLELTFTDESNGRPTGWSWDFGDGGTSSQQNPKHTYDEPGDYKVTLTVGNENGSDSTTKTVTVVAPPTADFSITQTPGTLEVVFTDEFSGNSGYICVGVRGRPDREQNPTHTYRNPGTYQVTLAVFNGGGRDPKPSSDRRRDAVRSTSP